MPLTAKGREILAAMKEEYGDEKGERVFYASKEAGKITGVDSDDGSTVDSLAALNARNRAIHPGGDWSADLARVRSWMATDEGFTAGMIEQLRAEFSKIKNVDPSSPTYQKMHALVERLSPEQLKQLAKAGVPFVSNMARGALLRRGIVGDVGKDIVWPLVITRGYDYSITPQQKTISGVIWKKYEAVIGRRLVGVIWRSEMGDIEETP